MKKTAVLFISHIVTDETLSRYKSLQDGCNAMGYDLFWAMDADSKHRCILPDSIQTFVFSFDEYRKAFPKMWYYQSRITNMTPCIPFMFNQAYSEYDYIWIVEFDVCCYGQWSLFFEQYDIDSADLISNETSFQTYEENPKRKQYRLMPPYLIKKLVHDKVLCHGLMCIARLSKQMLDDIFEFHEKANSHALFFEEVWPTVAKIKNRRHVLFKSNYFKWRPTIDYSFNNYVIGQVYHPVKEYICWNVIQRRQKQCKEDITLLVGFYSFGNVGDELMEIEMVSKLKNKNLVIVHLGECCYKNRQIPTNVKVLDIKSIDDIPSIRYLLDLNSVKQIVVGGGALFFHQILFNFLQYCLDKCNDSTTLEMEGISIDIDEDISKLALNVVKHASEVRCRDIKSVEKLRLLGVKNVSLCDEILQDIDNSKLFGIALSEDIMNNTPIDVIQYAVDRCRAHNVECIFIQMFYNQNNLDEILSKLDLHDVRYSVFKVTEYPTLTKHIIQSLCGLLSFKYHSALFALQSGIPTLSVFAQNRNKFENAHSLYKDFDCGCFHVSSIDMQQLVKFMNRVFS